MSIYPVLEVDSLVGRCQQDINTFIKQVLGGKSNSVKSVQYDLYTGNDFSMMKSEISTQLSIMNKILQSHNETMTSFDYAHDILHFGEQERNQLWIVRTLLCYQMMIFGTHIMSDPSLHAKVYKTTPFQRTFRPDVISELPSFKLGIFGSITPTSDIDIGIQYSGMTNGFSALDYVVATMEDMFILFLGVTSTLQLDIEYYADMMTLPNPNPTNTASPDLFYLDTMSFTENEFKEMLPYAYASIYRNYLTAKKDLKNTSNETDFIPRLNMYVELIDENAMNTAKQLVSAYMNLTYDKAREKYYELVRLAEANVAIIRGYLQTRNYQALTNDVIVKTMKAIAHALIFRAESYVCAPTVMHVVRLLQADPKREKYPVTYPTTCHALPEIRLKNPQCEIGRYGYEMSILEQIGYILRFQLTYCEGEPNHTKDTKCKKKLEKYRSRLDDAIERKQGISSSKGGRRKKSRSIQQKTHRNGRRKNYIKRTRKHTRV
jgi:hypothetical protein